MIEKLKVYEETPSGYKHPENTIQDKINELVDVVNELTSCVGQLGVEFTDQETPADPYAEPIKIPCKRKLKEITFEDDWYKEKEIEIEFIPDDDIIYKGE